MNRIDRLSGILIQLQARPIVKAQQIANRFEVSLRTVYRDIRALCEAGVPICGDAGIGYSLMEGYRLSPLMFTKEEALAFTTAEKIIEQLTDANNSSYFCSGMDKIRAVLRNSDKNDLAHFDERIKVYRNARFPEHKTPNLLQTILKSIDEQRAVKMQYYTPSREESTERLVEAVGVSYSYPHWYLSAYCHLRKTYRQFRLDRVEDIIPTSIEITKKHPPLKELFADIDTSACLTKVVLQTDTATNQLMGDQKYYFGLIEETEIHKGIWKQTYMCYSLDTMTRWLIGYFDTVETVEPQVLQDNLQEKIKQINKKNGSTSE